MDSKYLVVNGGSSSLKFSLFDKDENEILFNSINIPEIISLILKGINKAFNY